DGVPMVGFTWYSLTDQVDWDSALRADQGNVNPVGLYDLDRKIRPVGEAYKKIIREWGNVLPTNSVCLRVPVYSPRETKLAEEASARDLAVSAGPLIEVDAHAPNPGNSQESS
ncbi:MAG: glycoside hydrolase family 1 protein, partial [Pseudomonadota bacterium]|nr:glycoside hydrolase family 1 protein [Pseudomonadota bacterium]